MFLITLLSLIVVAAATGPQACCVGNQYSGVLLEVGGSHTTGSPMVQFSDEVLELQYDWDTKMMVLTNHMMNMTTMQRHTVKVRMDYKYSTTYITTEDGNCYKQALDPSSMQPPCVPSNFTYWGTTTVGSGMNGVRVNGFEGVAGNDRMSITVTADGECVPVTMTRYGEHGNVREVRAYLFTNIQKSIDTTLFNIPRNCVNAMTIPSSKRSLEELFAVRHPF